LTVFLAGSSAETKEFLYPHLGIALAVSIPVTILAGSGWGFLNGCISVKWKVPPFIVTLGTLGMALGLAQVISGGLNVPNVPPQLQESFSGGLLLGVVPWPVVLSGLIVSILWIVLACTRFGLYTYAVGANAETLRRSGVDVDRHVIRIYILMGTLCGIVALMSVSRFSTASLSAHTQSNLAAIAAVAIGGTSLFGGRGHMSGTVIGAFIPAFLRNGFILMSVQPFWQNVAIGAVLILAVYIDQVRRRGVVVSLGILEPSQDDLRPESKVQ
jgi:ribose transport system permease protein